MLVITPTFTANFNANFGVNAAAAQAAWRAAAQILTSNFTDNIHINITVDAVAGTSVFGESNTSLLSISYSDLLAKVVADATTQNDQTAIGAAGSMTVADPTNGTGTFFLTRSQAKALGVIPDDLSEDGTTTFGAGNPFTFSGKSSAQVDASSGACRSNCPGHFRLPWHRRSRDLGSDGPPRALRRNGRLHAQFLQPHRHLLLHRPWHERTPWRAGQQLFHRQRCHAAQVVE